MNKFKVGEVVILNPLNDLALRGVEATILSIVPPSYAGNTKKTNGYKCDVMPTNKSRWFFYESALRKKRPDEQLSTWQAIESITGWKRGKETVDA